MIAAEDAARAGVEGLDAGRRVVVPGLPMRAAMRAGRYVPHAVKLPSIERSMRREVTETSASAPPAARRDQHGRQRRPAARRRGGQDRADHGRVVGGRGGERAAARQPRARRCCSSRARRELLEELARARSSAAGGSAFVHPCDLADTDAVGELATAVLEHHGHVDVVVNNAGVSIRRWVSESYDRFHDIERTINVNYLGPVRLLLGLLPSMRERGSGHIVNVATIGVDFPPLRWSAYIASKAAFEVVARRRRAGELAPTA